ncbi:MAG: hypothetical protein K6E42_03765, partial [Synergistes sp.]|nr:hypothetical protein [Synergistes sp.]
ILNTRLSLTSLLPVSAASAIFADSAPAAMLPNSITVNTNANILPIKNQPPFFCFLAELGLNSSKERRKSENRTDKTLF